LIFLIANVITRDPTAADLEGARRLDEMFGWREPAQVEPVAAAHGPGYPLIHLLPRIPSRLWQNMSDVPVDQARYIAWVATARTMAILGQLAIVIGLALIGYRHFDNLKTGIAVATLYLLLPYTAQFAGCVDHVVPAALLVWAVFFYRRPLVAGILLGLAVGVIYYPLFLLPLWAAFYWQRGLARFSAGVAATLLLLVSLLWLLSPSNAAFVAQLKDMFGLSSLSLFNPEAIADANGFWDPSKAPYRLTVFVAFVVLCAGMALWPARKNLGTLLSCSAAIMLGTQFWHAQEGGLYMAWYLPFLVLTVFRPNLEDRMAISALDESWFGRRRSPWRATVRAA
jgi:hypothetical protein